MKKESRISIKTTAENRKFLEGLMSKSDRSMSYLISKMIDAFRIKGITDDRDIK
tara:strand:- start:662 stop:823 length:162 start_codon:yes stop_codon:yes gene_type:complete